MISGMRTAASASGTAAAASLGLHGWVPEREARPRPPPDPALDRTAWARPPGPIGVHTLWAMYLVLFVGSALQWILQT